MIYPSTPTFGRKHHWLLVIDDNNYSWSFILKVMSDLAETMLGLVNNLKIKFNFRYNTSTATMQVKSKPSKKPSNRKS